MLTGDTRIEEFLWKYVLWFYGYMDRIFVPSQATGAELESRGIAKEKIEVIQRGIDIAFFHPSKRNGCLSKRYNLSSKDINLLYVGRISKEKNISLLVKVYREIKAVRKNVHLIMVGDGPYLPNIKKELQRLPVVFAGYLEGEDLAQIYASSDIFLFPSTADTMGNVVLETQASGLPVIVTDKGGPQENMIAGKTGFVVSADNPDAFKDRILQLIDDAALLSEMKHSARQYMENRSLEASFLEFWNNYGSIAISG
jgi:glycosyltransferase involved in cell wall biosynthesis